MFLYLGNAIINKISCTGVYVLYYIRLSVYHKLIKENTHFFYLNEKMFQSLRALIERPDCLMPRFFLILPYIVNSNTPRIYSQC